jgi:hypothetical protein
MLLQIVPQLPTLCFIALAVAALAVLVSFSYISNILGWTYDEYEMRSPRSAFETAVVLRLMVFTA